jgi:hypothetical protein
MPVLIHDSRLSALAGVTAYNPTGGLAAKIRPLLAGVAGVIDLSLQTSICTDPYLPWQSVFVTLQIGIPMNFS